MNITNAGEHEVLLGFMGIGPTELLLILLIVLILFGAKKIPELAKGLGSGLREFRKAAKEFEAAGNDIKAAASDETSPADEKSADK